jgi:hypothetical protein
MAVLGGDEKSDARPARARRRPSGEPGEPGAAAGRTRGRGGAEGSFLPDLLRRGLTMGFTGFFMTEEALRRALGDSMPRDWMEFMVEQSEKTRAELLERLSREFGRVISAFDPVEILRRLLDGQTIEVSARIKLANSERARRGARREDADPEPEPEGDDE